MISRRSNQIKIVMFKRNTFDNVNYYINVIYDNEKSVQILE
jgi:hypothetical protein